MPSFHDMSHKCLLKIIKIKKNPPRSNDPLIKGATASIVNAPLRQAVRMRLMKNCVGVFESGVCVELVEMFCVSAKLSSVAPFIFPVLVSRLLLLTYAFLTSPRFLTQRK